MMKKIHSYKILLVSLLLLPMQFIYADDGQGPAQVNVAALEQGAATTFSEAVRVALAKVYNQGLAAYSDAISEAKDSPIVKWWNEIANSYQNLWTGQQATQAALNNYSKTFTDDSLSGLKVSEVADGWISSDLLQARDLAADDCLLDPNANISECFNLQSGKKFTIKKQDQLQGTDIVSLGTLKFDPKSLLGKDNYAAPQDASLALQYLQQLTNNIPIPDVIRIAKPSFWVPVLNPEDPNQKYVEVKLGSGKDVDNNIDRIRRIQQANPGYLKYRNNYRKFIALRNLYLYILQNTYQDRSPTTTDAKGNKISVRKMWDDLAAAKMSKTYHDTMAKAKPATVEREMLFALTEMNARLNTIQKQNDQLLLVNAVNGLATTAQTAQQMEFDAQSAGKAIYCAIPANQDSKICKTDITTGSFAETPDITNQ